MYLEVTIMPVRLFAFLYSQGSLDIQFTELWESCVPGDIRVHYETIEPKALSVIGEYTLSNGEPTVTMMTQPYRVGTLMLGIWNNPQVCTSAPLHQHDLTITGHGRNVAQLDAHQVARDALYCWIIYVNLYHCCPG